MSFTYHDVLEILGVEDDNGACSEVFSTDIDIKPFKVEDAIDLFPELADIKNQNVIYAPVRMCHTLPFINKRRRCFTLKTLRRSVDLVGDNLINFDHEISDNGIGSDQERICGHLKGAKLGNADDDGKYPLYALSALYTRHPEVKEMAKEHLSGDVWSVSMECGHNVLKSHFYYEGEFIPFKEAASDMLRCIKAQTINPYRGKELALAVGGEDGLVNFWGMALTKSPADENGNILSLFAAAPREIASSEHEKSRKMYFSLRSSSIQRNKENVKKLIEMNDNLLREAATIEVIGLTEESDGHKHEVLSDGTILPEKDHSHYCSNYSITPGKNPTFSMSLGTYDVHSSGEYNHTILSSHTHKCIISLKSQGKKTKSSSIFSENANSTEEGEEMSKLLDQLKQSIAQVSEIASTLKPKSNNNDDKVTVALNAIKTIENLDIDKAIASAVDEEVKEKIKDGDFVSKADHEAAIEKTKKETEDTINLKNKADERKTSRIQLVKDAGIDLNFVVSGEGDSAKTIKDLIEEISLDDAGETFFQGNLAVWKKLASATGKAEEREAANTKKVTPVSIIKIAGAGSSGSGKGSSDSNKPKFGKNALTVI